MTPTPSGKRRSCRFVRTVISLAAALLGEAALSPLHAEAPSATAGAYADHAIAFVDTRHPPPMKRSRGRDKNVCCMVRLSSVRVKYRAE